MPALLTITLALIGLVFTITALALLLGGLVVEIGGRLIESSPVGADETKLWQVGDHRLKKTKKRPHPMDDAGYRGHKPPKKTCYQCVDCEQVGKYRPRFKSKPCYEVIE